MSNAYWGYWLIILGVFIVVVMLLIQNITTGNTQTYSMIRETSESAMLSSIDYGYYRIYGEVKINKEKFMEVFIRRLSEVANTSTTYTIEFYEVIEAPPKISLEVSSKTATFNVAGNTANFDIVDRLDAILESNSEIDLLDEYFKYDKNSDINDLMNKYFDISEKN